MKKIEVIREVPFFKPLRDEDLRELAEICGVQGYVAGTRLFSQGDPSDSFFVIVAGEVEIRLHPPDGGQPKIFVLADGDFFGEMGVMRNAPRSGDAYIKSDAVLLKIMKSDFDRLMAVNKFFSGMVMECFLERSRQHLTARTPPPPPAAPPRRPATGAAPAARGDGRVIGREEGEEEAAVEQAEGDGPHGRRAAGGEDGSRRALAGTGRRALSDASGRDRRGPRVGRLELR